MSKRSAPSPLGKDEPSKKQKVTSDSESSKTNLPTVDIPVVAAPAATTTTPISALTDVPETHVEAGSPENVAAPEKAASKKNAEPKKKGEPKKAEPKKRAEPKKKFTTGAAPVADTFEPWTPPQPTIPAPSPYWGITPTMEHAVENDSTSPLVIVPMPDGDQPSARTSNGATNPPMWEDLGHRFQRGSRHVRYTSVTPPENEADLPADIDQEEHLQIRLIDMRQKSAKDRTPRRTPMTYHYGDDVKDENGEKGKLGHKPKDWDNKQAVKCLNDRRAQAIGRIIMEDAWTAQEREYLASLFEEFPDASIWEITARFNYRFMNDYLGSDGNVRYTYKHVGRTVESVRNQYMTHKPAYDRGVAPSGVRPSNNNSLASKEAARKWKGIGIEKYGSPSKELEDDFDAGKDLMEDNEKEWAERRRKEAEEKAAAEAAALATQAGESIEEADPSGEEANQLLRPEYVLTDADEPFTRDHVDELLEMAGVTEFYKDQTTEISRDSPKPTAYNQVAITETQVHRQTVVEDTIAEDGSIEPFATETVVEAVTAAVESALSSPPSSKSGRSISPVAENKRSASDAHKEKMKEIDEDYAIYDSDDEL